MYMKKTALAILAMSMFAASSAMAASPASELSASGNISSTKSSPGSGKSDQINATVGYGYYFTPRLVGKVVVFINTTESKSGTTTSKSGTEAYGLGAKYYFGDAVKSAWVPYVFADIMTISIKYDTGTGTGTGTDVGVGVSNFITESVSFDIEGKATSNSTSFAGTTTTSDGTSLNFGFTARF